MATNPRSISSNKGKHLSGIAIILFILFNQFSQPGYCQVGKPDSLNSPSGFYDTGWIDQLNDRSANEILLIRKDSALFYANLALAPKI